MFHDPTTDDVIGKIRRLGCPKSFWKVAGGSSVDWAMYRLERARGVKG